MSKVINQKLTDERKETPSADEIDKLTEDEHRMQTGE
jgi:hypothetical protein